MRSRRDAPTLTPATGDAGSVFVESIIAAAIVAMALGATYRVIADSAGRDRGVEQRRAALLVAQSELAAVGSEIPLESGQHAGLSGDILWRVDVTPYSDGVAAAMGGLWRVAVSVRPRDAEVDSVRLETLRLGPKA